MVVNYKVSVTSCQQSTRSTNHPQCPPKHPQLTLFANTPHPPVAPPTITYTHYTNDNAAAYTSDKCVLPRNTSLGHCCIGVATSNQSPTATISNPQNAPRTSG